MLGGIASSWLLCVRKIIIYNDRSRYRIHLAKPTKSFLYTVDRGAFFAPHFEEQEGKCGFLVTERTHSQFVTVFSICNIRSCWWLVVINFTCTIVVVFVDSPFTMKKATLSGKFTYNGFTVRPFGKISSSQKCSWFTVGQQLPSLNFSRP